MVGKYLSLFLLIILSFCFSNLNLSAQGSNEFSQNKTEFLEELKDFMTSSKRNDMEDLYKDFEANAMGTAFTEEEWPLVIKTCNLMLRQRMTASPYFKEYLETLLALVYDENKQAVFKNWHEVVHSTLEGIENRRFKPISTFFDFSKSFFEQNALKYSSTGTSWLVVSDDYSLKYEENQPVVDFKDLTLVAVYKQDSISIRETGGRYYPVEGIWRGQGGIVDWARHGLPEVYCELGNYEIEVRVGIYEVKNVKLFYPEYFPEGPIVGNFEDKVSTVGAAFGSSHPRFNSKDNILRIDNLGEGVVQYTGGFRLEGTTVYGQGGQDTKSEIRIFGDNGGLKVKARAKNFTIRKGEQIGGQRVETTLYFGKDSIFHPSVNFKFDLTTKELNLARGERGSDRNPFFDSYHQVNIHSEKLDWFLEGDTLLVGKKNIGLYDARTEATFESFDLYEENEYLRLQNISTVNPIATFKGVAVNYGNVIHAGDLAHHLNPRYDASSIQRLLFDMVAKGFVNYDTENQMVEIRDKVFHYADANRGKVDYDALKIVSEADKKVNGYLSMGTKEFLINDVSSFEFSPQHNVAALPHNQQLVLLKNRDMTFDGKVFAAFSTLEGKDFYFNYDKFAIFMDSVRYFDFFVPTGEKDEQGNPIALSIGSRIEHATGALLIDAPSNKSGKEEIPFFPSFNSKELSYVYYDKNNKQGGAYKRDSFYFELQPFSFNNLGNYTAADLHFEGRLVSAGIFPDIEETLVLREEDQSLGFVTETPDEGSPVYQEQGQYTGTISLSNEGLLAKGNLKYLGATTNSEDIVFKPQEMTATAERWDLQEKRGAPPEFPQALGLDVKILWKPYQDSMYVTTEEKAFELFKANDHTLDGTLILTPNDLRGNGMFDWKDGRLNSKDFSFGPFSVYSDTAALRIKAFGDPDKIALSNDNIQCDIDFDDQFGEFRANDQEIFTKLPFNAYHISMNNFDWDMQKNFINFESDPDKMATFLSVERDQDSLLFEGKTASYDLETSDLLIGGVPVINSCDALIYPDSGKVSVQPGGVMKTLKNARIVASTENRYHTINRATVDVKGKKLYTANGFYEYNVGTREQEIKFDNIIGQRVGKGARSEKETVTRATGQVNEYEDFYIDHKTQFQGTIKFNAKEKELQLDGFARLDVPDMPFRQWFSINSPGDKKNLIIKYDTPKSYGGEQVYSGLFISKETAKLYPRVMMPLFFRKDRPIFDAKGYFRYDQPKDQFLFGDSARVVANEERGSLLTYSVPNGKITAEGPMNIGSGLDYISVKAAGKIETAFQPPSDSADAYFPALGTEMDVELMAGVTFQLPEKVLSIVVNDLTASAFDAQSVGYRPQGFYINALENLIDDPKDRKEAVQFVKLNDDLSIPKKSNTFTVLFSKLSMKWDADYQSFVSTRDRIGVASFNGAVVNKMLKCYVEFKMPTSEDDRVYIYIQSPNDYFYFFGYKQGILSTTSNNPKYNEAVVGLKKKELFIKMGDKGFYEIQFVEEGTARMFVSRVLATRE